MPFGLIDMHRRHISASKYWKFIIFNLTMNDANLWIQPAYPAKVPLVISYMYRASPLPPPNRHHFPPTLHRFSLMACGVVLNNIKHRIISIDSHTNRE